MDLCYWKGMHTDIVTHITHCGVCQESKASNQLLPGLLVPLDQPAGRWTDWEIDFIGPLPRSASGFDSIILVCDRFTKRIRLIPNHTTNKATTIWQLVKSQVVTLFGYPSTIVSDADSYFTSKKWKALCNEHAMTLKIGTTDHHHTPGQAERAVRTVKEMIKGHCNHKQDNWDVLLPDIELVYNSAQHSSTGITPFMADIGREVHLPNPLKVEPCQSTAAHLQDQLEDTAALVELHSAEAVNRMQQQYNKSHRGQLDGRQQSLC